MIIADEKSRPTLDMPAPAVEQPPPAYTGRSGPSEVAHHPRGSPAVPAPPGRVLGPIVGRLSLSPLYEGISGSWRIDPSMPPASSSMLTEVIQAFGRRRNDRAARRAHRHIGYNAARIEPTVSLDTRHGAIVADLGFVGGYPTHSTVRATTRTGNIFIDLFEKNAGQSVDIEIYTRHGNSTLLLPPAFSGMLEIHSRRGKIDILPGLARYARVVSSTRRDVRLMIDRGGTQAGPGPSTSSTHADIAHLASRSGNFRVGLSVEDAGVQPEPSLWSRIGNMVGGKGKAGPSSGGHAHRDGAESSSSSSDSDSDDESVARGGHKSAKEGKAVKAAP